jgi:hypothetical protein
VRGERLEVRGERLEGRGERGEGKSTIVNNNTKIIKTWKRN